MEALQGALLTDLYQLTMIQAYLELGQTDTAVFEFFVRKLPPRRSFLVAAGLNQALLFVENLRFSADAHPKMARGRSGTSNPSRPISCGQERRSDQRPSISGSQVRALVPTTQSPETRK
jgi:hypothetical protein